MTVETRGFTVLKRMLMLMILNVAVNLLMGQPTSVDAARASRIVRIRQGKLQGIVLVPDSPHLDSVEAFLGVPYAGAPIGRLRFMPPSAPQSWPTSQVRQASEFGPVCPQIVPDLTKEKTALRYMTVGRMNYLKKLLQYLKQNQSEDCLYLNIYTPEIDTELQPVEKLPVIVFVHGESYEWNSGNPYDGSVLASYGQVVVITLNYRLGILGFLKTGLEDGGIGNFGLLDIIAALHWIQENISAFGGDPGNVTLMGHGTGASLTSLLLVSPFTQGAINLFHRAILMSGTSLAKSALVKDPRDITRQVARDMNCPLDRLADCLREKDVRSLLGYKVKSPAYSTPMGPYVDGTLIPKHPDELLESYSGQYEVLMGVTESEAFHVFPSYTISHGLTEEEKKDILRSMITSEFETYGKNLEETVQTILNEYRDFQQTREDKMVNIKELLEMFSDARAVAPLIQTGNHLSSGTKPIYLYVFSHATEHGYYPTEFGSVYGEDLPYVFGMPLVGGTYHFIHNYTNEEVALSKTVMAFWVNFAKTGSPGIRTPFSRLDAAYANYWPPYDPTQRKYLILDSDPKVSSHYRSHKIAIWNRIVPDIVSHLDTTHRTPPEHTTGLPTEDTTNDATSNGNLETMPEIRTNITTTYTKRKEGILSEENLPVSVIVIIGLVLLLINLVACAGVYYQKQKVNRREINLERKMKRLSDAGYRNDQVSQASGGKDDDIVFNTLNSNKSENGSIKRAHFSQQRSNSVREGGDGAPILKSALKKPNQSTEMLTDQSKGGRVVYNDQTFQEAAYPSLSRQSKSIPNISFSEGVDPSLECPVGGSMSRSVRPLSRSSTHLETQQQEVQEFRGGVRTGPDVLVMYDTRPEGESLSDDGDLSGKSSKTSSLSRHLPGFLKMRGKDDRPPPPIIEMVPVSTPHSTYQFPSRPNRESLYAQRVNPGCERKSLMESEYGITFPNYGGPHNPYVHHPPPIGVPRRPPLGGHYVTMGPPPPGAVRLTTPRHPAMMPVGAGSLPRPGKIYGENIGHPHAVRPTWHTGGPDSCLYGQVGGMPPSNRVSLVSTGSVYGRPPLNRGNSLLEDQLMSPHPASSSHSADLNPSSPTASSISSQSSSSGFGYDHSSNNNSVSSQVSPKQENLVQSHQASLDRQSSLLSQHPLLDRQGSLHLHQSQQAFTSSAPTQFQQKQPPPLQIGAAAINPSNQRPEVNTQTPVSLPPVSRPHQLSRQGSLGGAYPSGPPREGGNNTVGISPLLAMTSETSPGVPSSSATYERTSFTLPAPLSISSDGNSTAPIKDDGSLQRSELQLSFNREKAKEEDCAKECFTKQQEPSSNDHPSEIAIPSNPAAKDGHRNGKPSDAAVRDVNAPNDGMTGSKSTSKDDAPTETSDGKDLKPEQQDTEKALAGVGRKTPIVLRKLGEKTPPGTLKRDNPSCKSWFSQYSQSFLSKTIDTPVEDLPPLGDEEFDDDLDDDSSSSEQSKNSQA